MLTTARETSITMVVSTQYEQDFDDTCKYQDDFGNKPFQALEDLHDFQKMTNPAPPLHPEEVIKKCYLYYHTR
jgi:hypothetical protein